MYWKRWVLIFLVVTVLITAFEIAFQLLFRPETVAVLRDRLFSGQHREGIATVTRLVFLSCLIGGGMLMLHFRKHGIQSRLMYIGWLGLMGAMGMSALILLLTNKQ
jgi:hypothetical protein